MTLVKLRKEDILRRATISPCARFKWQFQVSISAWRKKNYWVAFHVVKVPEFLILLSILLTETSRLWKSLGKYCQDLCKNCHGTSRDFWSFLPAGAIRLWMSQLSGKFWNVSVMASHLDGPFMKNKQYKFLRNKGSKEESYRWNIYIH